MYRLQTSQCSTLWLISSVDARGRERSDLVPQPPLLSALAVVDKNLSRLSRQLLGDVPGDGLNVQGSFLRAKFKRVVAVVRLEGHPLLGGVQGSVVADDVAEVPRLKEGQFVRFRKVRIPQYYIVHVDVNDKCSQNTK